jgi:hypothetical protein
MGAGLGTALKCMYVLPPTGNAGINEHFCSSDAAMRWGELHAAVMKLRARDKCLFFRQMLVQGLVISLEPVVNVHLHTNDQLKLAQVRVLWIRTGVQARWRSMTKLGRYARPEMPAGFIRSEHHVTPCKVNHVDLPNSRSSMPFHVR